MSLRTHSFVWGGLAFAAATGLGLGLAINSQNWSNFIYFVIACVILCNNFVGSMIATVFSWGFVRMPGIIFQLDFDGCMFFISVKILFWIISTLISILFGLLAISLGMACSFFVYPFALYESFKDPLD